MIYRRMEYVKVDRETFRCVMQRRKSATKKDRKHRSSRKGNKYHDTSYHLRLIAEKVAKVSTSL